VRVLVVAIALCLAPALAAPQSLGDAARRQAGKRSAEAPPAKVYTDEDLRPAADEPAGVPSADDTLAADGADAAPPPAPAAEDAVRAQLDREAEERKRRERTWRHLAGAARASLAAAQREHDAVCGPGVLVLTGG
jgi:hypothetical protein